MFVPPAVFHHMPEHVSCRGSFRTGGDVAATDHKGRYIRSIAQLLNESGQLVGWVYLADDYKTDRAEYVQGNTVMGVGDRLALGLRLLPANGRTSISLLAAPLPGDLHVMPCK